MPRSAQYSSNRRAAELAQIVGPDYNSLSTADRNDIIAIILNKTDPEEFFKKGERVKTYVLHSDNDKFIALNIFRDGEWSRSRVIVPDQDKKQ